MENQVCMVTGATAGIGQVTARALAGRGLTVVGVGRNPKKCADTAAQIVAATGNPNVEFLVADLSAQRDIRRLAEQFKVKYERLDVLVNNAGAVFLSRHESADGLELTFALNHLGYFLLTHLLLDTLKASAPARIVNVASAAHQGARMDLNDLQTGKKYRGMTVYGQSKLANVLFTYELARRLEGTGVTANALHPGFVASDFGANNGWWWRLLRPLLHLFAVSVNEGAETSIYLATAPEVQGVTGRYFVKKEAVPSSPASYDEAVAARLWRVSEELTGLATPA